MKRCFDFSVALLALVILSPLLAVVAIAIWLSDFGSPFYAGLRVARYGRVFRMLKFRSMRPGASTSGVNSTASGDARITGIGKVLRRAKLDELPQLFNVLLGDMSLIGPRPQVPADAALYTQDEQRMLSVRPGITDLASIVFADEGDILAGAADPDLLYNQVIRPWKSRLALIYVERGCFSFDLHILLLTVVALVSRRRALDRVGHNLRAAHADPLLIRMALRREPLLPYPPPGSTDVVEHYAQVHSRSLTAHH